MTGTPAYSKIVNRFVVSTRFVGDKLGLNIYNVDNGKLLRFFPICSFPYLYKLAKFVTSNGYCFKSSLTTQTCVLGMNANVIGYLLLKPKQGMDTSAYDEIIEFLKT